MTPASSPRPRAGTHIADQYEALRRGALGEPLVPSAREGLAVLLGRGMWAWARAVTGEPSARNARVAPAATSAGDAPSRRLSSLLAELALAYSGRNL